MQSTLRLLGSVPKQEFGNDRYWLGILVSLLALLLVGAASGQEPKPQKQPRAPADYVIFDSDKAGAYFVAKPLKDKYDSLRQRTAALRTDIAEGRIDSGDARAQIEMLQKDLKKLLDEIDKAKLYIPGAQVHTRTDTIHVPITADEYLLIDCSDVEIRGWDGPGIQCKLEKTIFDHDGTKLDNDFAGIELVQRKESGKKLFGYYHTLADRQEAKAELERFVLRDYVGRDFVYLTLKGLTYDQGNRQITLEMKNEQGTGMMGSRWRRHAKLTVFVPKCKHVAVRGALGHFSVQGLNTSLTVQGQGDRDYAASFEVTNLGGSLTADNIVLHKLDGIRGNVSLTATAYGEDSSQSHDSRGVTLRGGLPRPSVYRDIQGDLRLRFCRADLTLEQLGGRIDVENEFGPTVWVMDRPVAKQAHRIVSQSGTIDVRLDPKALGDLPMNLFTECGAVHLQSGVNLFESKMFHGAMGDVISRSWHGFVRQLPPNQERGGLDTIELFQRMPAALYGKDRSPGVDIISRGGTVSVSMNRK